MGSTLKEKGTSKGLICVILLNIGFWLAGFYSKGLTVHAYRTKLWPSDKHTCPGTHFGHFQNWPYLFSQKRANSYYQAHKEVVCQINLWSNFEANNK